jgi:hypothetical protein
MRALNATYWRPPVSYTAGIPTGLCSTSFSHSTRPVSLSYARIVRSPPVAAKIRPPAVTTGPLRLTPSQEPPVSLIPRAANCGTVPNGTRQRITPSLRSSATSSAHGGEMTGRRLSVNMTCPDGP